MGGGRREDKLLEGLRKAGFRPSDASRVSDAADGTRRYHVSQSDGPPLDVCLVDRERSTPGFLPRLLRRARLRSGAVERAPRTPREAADRAVAVAELVASSGAPAPRLLATAPASPAAVLLVYEHVEGRTLDQLADADLGDELQVGIWRSLGLLHERRIAHRALTADAVLVNSQGVGVLQEVRNASIAADDLALGLDVAQLLVVFALRVGPEPAVAAAVRALGEERVAAAVPLLQPAALGSSTRADLRRFNGGRGRELMAGLGLAGSRSMGAVGGGVAAGEGSAGGDLLAELRMRVLEVAPGALAAPIRLERIRVRTVLTALAGLYAAYYVFTRFPAFEFDIAAVDDRWLAVAFLAALVCHPVASLGLIGFVPERLPYGRVLLAQLAGSFVKLVAPVQLAGVAFSARFLQKSGVRPALALASIGVSQLALGASRMLLLLTVGAVSGLVVPGGLMPTGAVAAGLSAGAAGVPLVVAVPALRRWAVAIVRRVPAGVVPRLLDLLRRPGRLVIGFAGHLLLSVSYVLCLVASLRAFGGSGDLAALTAAFLTAHAVGSAVPSPGGIGAVEAALAGALTGLAHVPADIAAPTVLLYRVLVFWMPVLPGWICFGYLQRKGAL